MGLKAALINILTMHQIISNVRGVAGCDKPKEIYPPALQNVSASFSSLGLKNIFVFLTFSDFIPYGGLVRVCHLFVVTGN